MKPPRFGNSIDVEKLGRQMHDLMSELYPICRSITGNGVRKTLQILKKQIPIEVREVPSGTKVFDWTVPKEWNISAAYVENSKGERVIDLRNSNLHVLNCSVPIRRAVSLNELREHLFTLPEQPDWIPYRTSYYQENWGFCLSHKQFTSLAEDTYKVHIDSSLENGSLTYGEFYVKGQIDDEVLISTHVCHPAMCNDNLSGVVLSAFLARHFLQKKPRYSLRFLFIPGTIGAITWLSENEASVPKIKHGLVVACVGDSGRFTYKKSRRGSAEIDKMVEHILKYSGLEYEIRDFSPYGYDERQFCSPGFNLPVGCLSRSPHGEFPEYHTSADNLDFVKSADLAVSFATTLSILDGINANETFVSRNPKCEPQLGRRGLYESVGGDGDVADLQMALLWVLNLADGQHSLLEIADRADLDLAVVKAASDRLREANLLRREID